MKIQSDVARNAWMNDPRLSNQQRGVIAQTSKADDDAEILGLDSSFQPVVACMAGVPLSRRVFAIKRNGDPTAPMWEDRNARPNEDNLREPWLLPRKE
jgi:hypothetical protein